MVLRAEDILRQIESAGEDLPFTTFQLVLRRHVPDRIVKPDRVVMTGGPSM